MHAEKRQYGRWVMTLEDLDRNWDLVIAGGGITGAGIFSAAARMGLKTLLLEQHDFAWGTSSRSSKMIHGGLRYLKKGNFLLTRESVKERERLLCEAPGLVEPLGFLMPLYRQEGPPMAAVEAALSIYSVLAFKKTHTRLSAGEMAERINFLNRKNLAGGFYFTDAQADDARLVLRLINQGRDNGGTALNYTEVTAINRDRRGWIAGVTAADAETGKTGEFDTKAVINATGVRAETLHAAFRNEHHIRPLRGSHLIFSSDTFFSNDVISFFHPADRRPVFISPWEGCTLVGTTDVDHSKPLDREPAATKSEAAYLLAGLRFILPGLDIAVSDAIATMAGIRPVLGRGNTPASDESRAHALFADKGLVTVTGGKLTTFRLIAADALAAVRKFLPAGRGTPHEEPVFQKPGNACENTSLQPDFMRRVYGRYGQAAAAFLDVAAETGSDTVPGTSTLWAELTFAARFEKVRHLSDLLLRRVRLGVTCREGARAHLDTVEKVCRPFLPWDSRRWETEKRAYMRTWQQYYSPFPWKFQ